ncbi:MAG: guanylate kinase [Rhodocyclaceae bacterium]|nr:guanylate kinase [Rhodocyclaceae bacterium]
MTQNASTHRAGPGSLFVIAAPSGAGKTTLTRMALAQNPRLALSISTTTRAPRPGECDGVDYHFVSVDAFKQMQTAGEFLESAEVHGNFYGTTCRGIEALLSEDRDVILEIDWQGAQQVRGLYPESVGIFILPPSFDVLERRLQGRGQDSAEVIARRVANAREELQHLDEFPYVIINENLDEALAELLAVFAASRLRLENQMQRAALLMASYLHRI